MKFKFIFSTLVFVLALFQGLTAQKFGHINSGLIIEQHPKVTAANAELEAYQKVLSDSLNMKAQAFEAKYTAYLKEAQTGNLSKVSSDAKEAELRTEQETLKQLEQQYQFRILQRRETLLKPILEEIDAIIQAIGKEGNYTMIFDTSVAGGILFAIESDDLTEAVKGRCMVTK